ncbi:hypothetical protein BKA82DRAFT_4465224, partial [Pisolithus tinctorius]
PPERKPSRRVPKESGCDDNHARETEHKRNNGQLSCAECNRLKIKCDKQIPCQSCRRRGCAALCPNGTLTTGQGTRFVLAATEHLHRRISKMSERIRQLEDSLGELQAQHSTEPHPLLRPDSSGASQRDDDVGPLSADDSSVADHAPELVEALGTLSISDNGASRFFGATGGSHLTFVVSFDGELDPALPGRTYNDALQSDSPPSQDFADGSTLNVEMLANDYLPTRERACYLTETYLEQTSWLVQHVSKDQILLKLLPAYYVNGVPHVALAGNYPHILGLLFLVFAIGALVDPNQEPGNAEAELYHQAAHAAICLQSVMERPSLETIQALHLLGIYNTMSGNELAGMRTSIETSWSLAALAAHLAHTAHRDGLRWGLSREITTRRRIVFWDLFVTDVWNCLEAGRPPTFSLPYIDCQFPRGGSPHDKLHIGSDKQALFGSWTLRFASDCVADVAARTLTSEPPSYSTILELDHKVRNFPVTEAVEEFASGALLAKPSNKDISAMESTGRFLMSNSREVILLYIHRSYFAQAIIENPTNPLKSSYTPSFLAAYRASLTILRTVKAQYDLHPTLTARLWPIWTHAFSASIVFGTIVTRGPRSPMASDAMKELRDACILFCKASTHSRRAQKALPIITKLLEKAHNALLHAQSDVPNQLGQQWSDAENEGGDELAIFAGRMKFVSVKDQTADGMLQQSPNSDGSARRPSSPTPESQQQQKQVEPTVLQSYSLEELGSTWLQQPDSVADQEHTQEMPTWDQSLYPDASSQPILMQLPPASLQIPSHVQSQAPPHGGPVLGSSPLTCFSESSDPYPISQGCHPYHHLYGPQANISLSTSTLSTVSYYDDPLINAGQLQSNPSTYTHPHMQPHPQQPIQPLPYQYEPQPQWPSQPIHPHPPQSQPLSLAPPELAQLGLIAQESGLDQRWTSFMRESGFFDGYGYQG